MFSEALNCSLRTSVNSVVNESPWESHSLGGRGGGDDWGLPEAGQASIWNVMDEGSECL